MRRSILSGNRSAATRCRTVRSFVSRSRLGLNFPASEIQELKSSFDELTEHEKQEMFINFMGMVGISGVMPIHTPNC
ncbi:MAG: type VI secretion system baseplate subunit TssG [Acidobacteria bacterium]|nr:type VI secretion system baseplate subunit TssG [Acidobacteriota bacterium]